ncbi:hypothetical protein QBC35DRAFT_455455 [Podospora australis]|uniref:Uncharacterized protein n=1 Tax=Podospora australis TaxID=1536484 RepID=A0AAN6WLW4_9PEZI|nr:hypothetical protein QBC35DRAFT_455455 [Podospora australis]
MPSYPFTQHPPFLDGISSSKGPEQERTTSGSEIPQAPRQSKKSLDIGELDPETSRLLPIPQTSKRLQHHVRVQGKLVLVKSVSIADLKTAGQDEQPPSSAGYEAALGGSLVTRSTMGEKTRISLDDIRTSEKETHVRDRQLRGYGIGGAGNIRRPTDVIHANHTGNKKWNIREILGLPTEPKGTR